MKKIIGLSCGRKNGNSEFLLKEAAMGAEESGVETEIIRAAELDVNPCSNCQTCVRQFRKGEKVQCIIQDDVKWILEKTLLEDCALIVSGPVYHLRANSTFMAINDRMNATAMGNLEVLTRKKLGAIIAVGGAGPDWTNLALLMNNIFIQHTRILVDQVQVTDSAEKGAVFYKYNENQLSRVRQLGRNVAQALEMPIEEVKFMGEENVVSCPVCHCNVLQVPRKLPEVYCPVCWIRGNISFEGKDMMVKWNMEDVACPRFSEAGIHEHGKYIMEIEKKAKVEREKNEIKEKIEKYKSYGKILRPPQGE